MALDRRTGLKKVLAAKSMDKSPWATLVSIYGTVRTPRLEALKELHTVKCTAQQVLSPLGNTKVKS